MKKLRFLLVYIGAQCAALASITQSLTAAQSAEGILVTYTIKNGGETPVTISPVDLPFGINPSGTLILSSSALRRSPVVPTLLYADSFEPKIVIAPGEEYRKKLSLALLFDKHGGISLKEKPVIFWYFDLKVGDKIVSEGGCAVVHPQS